jgi:hypothetical protein
MKNASVLHDDHKQIIGAVETLADITELIERKTARLKHFAVSCDPTPSWE